MEVYSSLDKSIHPYKQTSTNNRFIHGGTSFAPPPPSFRYPDLASAYSLLNLNPVYQRHPPLLPLPISKPYMSTYVPSRTPRQSRGFSSPPINTKTTRPRDPSKQPVKRVERVKSLNRSASLRPDRNVIPSGVMDDLNKFSGPPPSSLPLPKFSLRLQRSCNTEASGTGIDAGATDNLRQLLRLR